MSRKEFDYISIYDAVIDSWPLTLMLCVCNFLYVWKFPHLLPDEWGMSILCTGVALTPLIGATFMGWIIEERWVVWYTWLKNKEKEM